MKLVLAAIVICLATTPALAVKKGDHFTELDAKSADGKRFRLKDMAGKWVLFTFGASWCGPCSKELPAWDRIAPKFKGKIVFVSVNINNKLDEGKQFMTSLKLKHIFPVFMPDDDSPAMKTYDPDRMPSTFVIDPKGVVQLVQYGYDKGDEDKLIATLNELTKS
jgi:thiol-disulfide isomerase/thioredoxin